MLTLMCFEFEIFGGVHRRSVCFQWFETLSGTKKTNLRQGLVSSIYTLDPDQMPLENPIEAFS